ncbi:MAG: FAD:protein FMN transferase [Clostridia bacterium]|nr:FAD:protein FMN transferase [Clostridia bacterium]
MKRFLLILIVILVAAGYCSCGGGEAKNTRVFYEYFDTVTEITAFGETDEEFDRITDEIENILKEYHRLADIYNEYSGTNNLCTVNKKAGKEPVAVSEKLLDLMEYGKEVYSLTCGETNIAIGAVTKLWHDAAEDGNRLPEENELKEAAKHCNIEDIVIDRQNGTLFLKDEKMSVDMGAVAKGYACEMAARYLEQEGKTGYALNLGGNLRVTGKKPGGEFWTAGIQNPDLLSDQGYINVVYLKQYALVTSGSYMRYFTVEGKTYHHIIDTDTLYPKDDFKSVSVLCGNSALGDALSTALFNMSLEEGMSLVNKTEDLYALWVDKDGKVHYSEGFEEYIKE